MIRRLFALAALVCWMGASVQVVGQGTWRKGLAIGPDLVPGAQPRGRLAGVEIEPFGGFQFDPWPNGIDALLSPALDQPAVIVCLNGPPSFVTSKPDVWLLRRDATVAPQRARWTQASRESHGPGGAAHCFLFYGAPLSDVAGIAASIDGQLHVRTLVPK